MLLSASADVVPYPHSWWKVIHLLCQLQKEASIFETFIYWAQKYTVMIYLNENTSLYLLRNPETLHAAPIVLYFDVLQKRF